MLVGHITDREYAKIGQVRLRANRGELRDVDHNLVCRVLIRKGVDVRHGSIQPGDCVLVRISGSLGHSAIVTAVPGPEFGRLCPPMAEINEELNELKEHAEHAALDPKLAPVSFTMAVLAVVLATITLLGHRAHTHQVVLQTRANDEWSYYQGKSVRRSTNEVVAKLMTAMDFKDKE